MSTKTAPSPTTETPSLVTFYRRGQERPTIGACGEGGDPFFLRVGVAYGEDLPVERCGDRFIEFDPLPRYIFDARPTPCGPIIDALDDGNHELQSGECDIPIVVEQAGARDAYRIRKWSRQTVVREYPHDTYREGRRRSGMTPMEFTGVALKPASCLVFTAIVTPDSSGEAPKFILKNQ